MWLRPRGSPAFLITRMSETISARLSTAVSGGGLTKTDADAMKADMTGRLDVALAQKGMRGPGGGQRPAGPPPPPPGGSGGSGEQLIADLAASTGTSLRTARRPCIGQVAFRRGVGKRIDDRSGQGIHA